MSLVFVYGTLKRGCSNHRLLADQIFRGAATTVPGYRLYAITDYPGMVRADRSPDLVRGEVWQVTTQSLERLDQFEGVPQGLYERVAIPLQAPFERERVEGYLFRPPVAGRAFLGPVWEED